MKIWLYIFFILLFCFTTLPSLADGISIQYASLKWGSQGTGDGNLFGPTGIATDSHNDVYIADRLNERIDKFTPNGHFIIKWHIDRQPWKIAIDSHDNVFVLGGRDEDWGIEKFSSDGKLSESWGEKPTDTIHISLEQGEASNAINSADIVLDLQNNVHIVYSDHQRIYSNDGKLIVSSDSHTPKVFDSKGNFFQIDKAVISKFDSGGKLVTKWGSYMYRGGSGTFESPSGIAIDSHDNVYVIDNGYSGSDHTQVFTSDGIAIAWLNNYIKPQTAFTPIDSIGSPNGIAIDSNDDVYVVGSDGSSLVKFPTWYKSIPEFGSFVGIVSLGSIMIVLAISRSSFKKFPNLTRYKSTNQSKNFS